MTFGKIVNNEIVFAHTGSNNVNAGDKFLWGRANKEMLLNAGFKELIPTESPEEKEGVTYYYTWEIVNGEITCVWHEAEISDDE